MTDVAVATISAAYSPQEEKIHALSRVKRGNLAELSPKIWLLFGKASNPQTPNDARQINERASVPRAGAGETPKGAASIYRLGLPAPTQQSCQGLNSTSKGVSHLRQPQSREQGKQSRDTAQRPGKQIEENYCLQERASERKS